TTGRDITPANAAIAVPTNLTTVTTAEKPAINCGINPININIGPTISINAAAPAAIYAIIVFVLSDNPLNQSANFVSHSAALRTNGISADPSAICTPSKAELSSVSAPFKLSCMTSAISAAAPLES